MAGIWIFVAACLVLIVAPSTMDEVARTLVGLNGGFEIEKAGLPVNWRCSAPEGDAKVSLDTENAIEGKQSLKFLVNKVDERRSPSLSNVFLPVKWKPYKVSFWLKNRGCKIDLTLRCEGTHDLFPPTEGEARDIAAHPPIKKTLGEEETGVNTWRQFEYIFEPSETDHNIGFHLRVTQPGTLWIDDVRIEEAQNRDSKSKG